MQTDSNAPDNARDRIAIERERLRLLAAVRRERDPELSTGPAVQRPSTWWKA